MSANEGNSAKKNYLKLAAIPLLLAVLGVVVWSNQTPGPPQTATVAAASPAASPAVASPAAKVESSPSQTGQQHRRVAWPKFTAQQILATNPFHASPTLRAALQTPEQKATAAQGPKTANPDSLEPGAESETEDPWSSLVGQFEEDAVGVYVESSKGPAFKIGARLYRVGDEIGGGYRVTAIRPDGIVVEALTASK